MRRRVAHAVAVLAAAAFAVTGCGDGGSGDEESSPSPSARPDRIVVAAGSAPRTLDPALATRNAERLIASATQLPLLTYRHRTGDDAADLLPALARDLPRLSDDRREYRFALRPGLVYSDGRLVKASDVERAIAHASRSTKDPRVREILRGIVGTPSTDGETLRGVRTDDRNGAVVVRLREPDGRLPQILADPATAPLPELPSKDPRVLPPATGPLRVARVERGSVELVANPLRAQIDTVPAARTSQVAVVGRPARAAELTSGDVGVAFAVEAEAATAAGGRAAPLASVEAASGALWSLLVPAVGSFAERDDREALAGAVDRRPLSEAPRAGRSSCGLLSPWIVGATTRDDCPPVPVRPTDAPLAGVTVRVGVPAGLVTAERADVPATRVLTGPDAVARTGAAAETIALRAVRALGATVTTQAVASADAALARGEIDAALVRAAPTQPHPAEYLRPVAGVDALIARELPDQTAQPLTGSAGAWSDLERRAVDRAVAIPISAETTRVAVSRVVDGRSIVLHPVLGLDLAALRVQ